VDRGEPALTMMRKLLSYFYDRHAEADVAELESIAQTIIGMVAADATEVHVAGYLRSVARGGDPDAVVPPNARLTAIALWHVAKVALTRDTAERVLRSDVATNPHDPGPLSHWLAARLLTPEELAEFDAEGSYPDDRT
jgi:hypothetical protein